MRVFGASCIAAVALLALGPPAAAAQGELPEIALLSVAPCAESGLEPTALGARLRIELTSDGIRDVQLVDDPQTAETLGAQRRGLAVIGVAAAPCGAEGASFSITIDDLVTHKRVERVIDLREEPAGTRGRVLALAIAELLRASWWELSLEDPPADAPTGLIEAMRVRWRARRVRHEPPPSPPPPERARTATLAAAFVVRAFPGGNSAQIGGRASIDLVPVRELALRIDAEGLAGSSSHPLGAIDLGLATLGVTAAWLASAGDVLLSIGPRVAGGVAWAAGRSNDPGTTTSTGAGPVLTLGGALEIDVRLAAGWSLRFGVEAAGVAVGFEARVAAVPVASVSGGVVAAWAGIALAP